MASNIRCFAGCNNAVIGQCAGYRDKCGQFYCPAHADGTLCRNCGGRKRLEAIVRDYWATAERIYAKEPDLSIYMIILLGIIAGICTMAGAVGGLVFCAVLAAPVVIFIIVRRKTVEKAIDDMDKRKPGFYEICQMYLDAQAARENEALKDAVWSILGGVMAGTVKGVGNSVNAMVTPDATRNDILRAIQSLKR